MYTVITCELDCYINSQNLSYYLLPSKLTKATTMFSVLLSLLFIFTGILFWWQYSTHVHRSKLPPGPKPLPIIGNLHLLGKQPTHRALYKLSQIYGSIMSMRLGSLKCSHNLFARCCQALPWNPRRGFCFSSETTSVKVPLPWQGNGANGIRSTLAKCEEVLHDRVAKCCES